MSERHNISSGGPWEGSIGYSRAVCVDGRVLVSGTSAALPDGSILGPGDTYAQAVRCLDVIEAALAEAGSSAAGVVRTRVYLAPGASWEEAGRAHGERFGNVRPALTVVYVAALMHPEMLVEIEAEAVVTA